MTCCKDGEEATVGETVVVGMRMDASSKEILTWVLVKVASAGDRVIAVHVLPAVLPESNWNPCSLISLIKDFDAMLAVYEGFCNLKQIDLKMKICRGSSIRRTLVQEAISVSASKIIVGVSKNSNGLGSSSVSVAKYCAKKLSRGCLVLAVNNGKIVYEKDAAGRKLSSEHLQKNYSIKLHNMNEQIDMNLDAESGESLSFDSKNFSSFDSSENEESKLDELTFKPSCSPGTGTKDQTLLQSKKEKPLVSSIDCSSTTATIRESSDRRPGWFLLRTALNQKEKLTHARSKSSVVNWVMRLPSRYHATPIVHSNHKRSKSDMGVVTPSLAEEKEIPKELLSLLEKYSSVCRVFEHIEVSKATSNFSSANIIGRGGSCKVYKGCLPNDRELAFKTLRCSENLFDDFITEIEIITNLHHKNIVSLHGFCYENNRLVLVYDFLSRGSLEENLHGIKGDKTNLCWADRYKIAIGVAEALNYLHNDENREPVIHRDIKSSNILLSENFEPQLCDFGLAQWASSSVRKNEATDCSDLAGTFGYLAPEYFMCGNVDAKIDVYAFGVVLLELLTGRKPVCTGRCKGEESLVMWARPILLDENYDKLVDSTLGDNYNSDEMERMCLAASLCIRHASHSRPSSALALKLLKGEDDAVEWARSELSSSMAFDDSDDESVVLHSNIQSHINLALLDEEDEVSTSSTDHQFDNFLTSNTSLEDYLKARSGRAFERMFV